MAKKDLQGKRVVLHGSNLSPESRGRICTAGEAKEMKDGRWFTMVEIEDGKKAWVAQSCLFEVREYKVAKKADGPLGLIVRGRYIQTVNKDGPAAATGIPVGSRIESVNGKSIDDVEGLRNAVVGKELATILASDVPEDTERTEAAAAAAAAARRKAAVPAQSPFKQFCQMGSCLLLISGLLFVVFFIAVSIMMDEDQQRRGQQHPHHRHHQYHQQQQQQQQQQQEHEQQQALEALDLPDFYALLELPNGKAATTQEIKSAFRRLSKIHHPDASSERSHYEQVREAYDVLLNPRSRKLYDVLGITEERSPKLVPNQDGPDSRFELRISLADAYTGASHTAVLQKRVTVGLDGVRRCQRCTLQPAQLQRVNMGMMVMQQWVQPDCRAACHWQSTQHRVVDQELDVAVAAGVRDGHQIRYDYEGDQYIDRLPGSVVLTVAVARHKVFTRQGNDLSMVLKISLLEALAGISRTVKHLDGHTVEVASTEPVGHGRVLVLRGEGMPNGNGAFGDLRVHIEVVMPSELSEDQEDKLIELFAGIAGQESVTDVRRKRDWKKAAAHDKEEEEDEE